MKMIRVAAALGGEDHLALRDGDKFIVRIKGQPDRPMVQFDNMSPYMAVAALVTKWGFDPVIGVNGEDQPEVEDGKPIRLKRAKYPDGGDAFQIIGPGWLARIANLFR